MDRTGRTDLLVLASGMEATAPFWLNRRIFVTGATGLLGARVVAALVDAGANVSALIPEKSPSGFFRDHKLYEKITIVRGRLEDRQRFETALAIHEPATIFQLAKPRHDDLLHPSPAFLWAVLAAARIAAPAATVVVPVPLHRTVLDDVLDGFRTTTTNPLAVARVNTPDLAVNPEDVALFVLSLAQSVGSGMMAARETRTYQIPTRAAA